MSVDSGPSVLLPLGHSLQTEAPAAEKLPTGQGVAWVSVGSHLNQPALVRQLAGDVEPESVVWRLLPHCLHA